MADPVLASYVKDSPIVKAIADLSVGVADPYFPSKSEVLGFAGSYGTPIIKSLLPSFAFDQPMGIDFPGVGLIDSAWLDVTMAATATGTYASFPGLNLVKSIREMHGTETLAEYNYQPVMTCCIDSMDTKQLALILANAGGVTPGAAAAVNFKVPLPLFFSDLRNGRGNGFPLPAGILASPFHIDITWTPLASMLAATSTGGSVTSINLVVQPLTTNDDARIGQARLTAKGEWKFVAQDFATIRDPTSLATATDTTLSLDNMDGLLKRIVVCNHLTSNLSTAHDFYTMTDWTSYELTIDGSSFRKITSKADQDMFSLFHGDRYGLNATFGNPLSIELSGSDRSMAGGLLTRAVRAIQLVFKQTSGAACTVDLVGVRRAVFGLDSTGRIYKIK